MSNSLTNIREIRFRVPRTNASNRSLFERFEQLEEEILQTSNISTNASSTILSNSESSTTILTNHMMSIEDKELLDRMEKLSREINNICDNIEVESELVEENIFFIDNIREELIVNVEEVNRTMDNLNYAHSISSLNLISLLTSNIPLLILSSVGITASLYGIYYYAVRGSLNNTINQEVIRPISETNFSLFTFSHQSNDNSLTDNESGPIISIKNEVINFLTNLNPFSKSNKK
jgi:hypothetical protein